MKRRTIFNGTPAENKACRNYWGQVFRDNAEAWWTQQGKAVPPTETPEYLAMYNTWIDHMRNE